MYTPTSGCVRLGGDAGWSGGLIRARVWWWVQLRRRCGQVVELDRIVMLPIRLGYHRMQFSASHLGPLGCWFPLIMYHHSQAFLRCSGVLRPCSWLGLVCCVSVYLHANRTHRSCLAGSARRRDFRPGLPLVLAMGACKCKFCICTPP